MLFLTYGGCRKELFTTAFFANSPVGKVLIILLKEYQNLLGGSFSCELVVSFMMEGKAAKDPVHRELSKCLGGL